MLSLWRNERVSAREGLLAKIALIIFRRLQTPFDYENYHLICTFLMETNANNESILKFLVELLFIEKGRNLDHLVD